MKRSSMAALAGAALGGYAATRIYRRAKLQQIPPGAHVVILGAGFGGLAAAKRLARLTGGRARITLVDRNNYHLFTPMLYQVASCSIVPYDVAVQLRPLLSPRGVHFRKAAVTGIDFDRRQVETDTGAVGYDYLVIALGSTTNYFGNSSAERHAMPVKSLEDGLAIRNHVIDVLEEASQCTDSDERRALLTFVIVGGGATGVETAGAMSEVVRHVMAKDYPNLRNSECRVIVVEAGPKLLGHMGQSMAKLALEQLQHAGVEVWLNTKANEVGLDCVKTEDGKSPPARTVVWTTGVRAPDVVSRLSLAHGHGGSIEVNDCLQVPGHTNVFAIGDNAHAAVKDVPLLAAAAMQEGVAAADSIVRLLRRQAPVRFRYKNLGTAVSVGHGQGVAEVGGRVIGGLAGWLTWRLVHLARIATFRNKAETLLDWTTAFVYDVETARLDVDAKRRAA
jgi:NADH dehydrogenase